jgi:hypothetical protein
MKQRQRKYRKLQQAGPGRALLRRRTAVEHALAHIAGRKGHRARYVGDAGTYSTFDRSAAIQNLEGLHGLQHAA